ncbi:hypothetical protein ACFOON_08805 [Novosphingobium piscinae]|uniref:Uncharacterized protein n=1 Tax=Novosphingobium piscinae TaxID=1507448 RepID=A0A7X1KQ16_9SPHN|nr:hypothetical protein [Novosphingobium piscinae]MBC2669058.1 hypothetical protein [Novosphingobium piscinae]
MARIDRHPDVKDYVLELSLVEIAARGGLADLFEQGHLVLIRDYRLPVDFGAFAAMEKDLDLVLEPEIRRRVKKLTTDAFLDGEPPVRRSRFDRDGPALRFKDPLRQAIFDVLCRGDAQLFEAVKTALRRAQDEIVRIFGICFPTYRPFRFIPSIRLTQTFFENLHWDNHSIDDDFHQARIFANLDTRPRIWHISHHSDDYIRQIYEEQGLARFAGKDPNALLEFIHADLLGGTRRTWMEALPKHKVAFDPGEVWVGESRLISHQIYYGEAAMVFMWFMRTSDMACPESRFNARFAAVHDAMAKGDRPNPPPV